MPAKTPVAEAYLALKPAKDGGTTYLLEAYDVPPTVSDQPQASATLAQLDYTRLSAALGKLHEGKPQTGQPMGDYLAEWLFMEPVPSTPLPPSPTVTLPYNLVGAYLQERARHTSRKQPLCLWLCVDQRLLSQMQFCGYIAFECLEHNTVLPVKVRRGVVGQATASPSPAASSPPLEIADKLRILLIYANPDPDKAPPGSPYPHLEHLARHFDVLCAALDPLLHARELFLETLRNPTPAQVREVLTRSNPHVLVFAGHGYASGQGARRGGVVCVEQGAPAKWPFAELVKAVQATPDPALRLAVFIACKSFLAASALLAAGVPAVEAMQPLGGMDFPEESVTVFARPFFRTLAHLAPLTTAHTSACQALAASSRPAAALMPTLWLATTNDQLFASPEDRLRAAYLDALLGKTEIALLPFPAVAGGVSLHELYVDQTVMEEPKTEPAGPAASAAADRMTGAAVMQEAMQRIEVDLWQRLKSHHYLMVVAPAWTGKSTLCRWVTQHCVQRTDWLPIFVPFRRLTQSRKSVQRYIQEDYMEWLGLEGRTIEVTWPNGSRQWLPLGDWLCNLWHAGKALLIVDGVDEEFDQARREQALHTLPRGQQQTTRPRVLLTSRPLGESGVLGTAVLTLQEFTRPQIERLVRQCGTLLGESEKAARFLQDIRQPEKAAALDLAARPGHLVQMLVTYIRDGVVLTAEEEVMQRVAAARFAITGRVAPSLTPDEPVYKRQVAEEVCFHLAICQQGKAQSRTQMLHLVSHALLEVKVNGIPVYAPQDGVTMLEDLCHNSGFLTQTPRGDYEVESIPWLQFFAACRIARKLRDDDDPVTQWLYAERKAAASAMHRRRSCLGHWLPLLAQRGTASSVIHQSSHAKRCPWCEVDMPPFSRYLWRRDWHGVVLLLAGLLADATPLLQRIAREPDDIFKRMLALRAHALGRASHVDTEVVQTTCERLMQAWQARFNPMSVLTSVWIDVVLRDLRGAKTASHTVSLANALRQAFTGQDDWVRWRAAEALGRIGDTAAVPALYQALTEQHVWVRWRAAEALGRIGDTAVVPALCQALTDQDEKVRWRAAEALGRIGDTTAVPALYQALTEQHVWVRWRAAEALGRIGDTAAVPALCQALTDQDEKVRWRAAEALGRIGDTAAVPALCQALTDQDEKVRWRAAEALGRIGDTAAVPALCQALTEQHVWVRMYAAEALGRIGDTAVVPALCQALTDQDEKVRWCAAEALGRIGDTAVVPALYQALTNQDEKKVRWRAAEALYAICERQNVRIVSNGQIESIE